MPIWAICLEVLFWVLFPVVVYLYAKMWLVFNKFNRVYDLTEDAHSFGRIDELRAINLEISRRSKRFFTVLVVYMIVVGAWTYLWVVPHAEGLR
jgi:peptidoglycan/LPS O-acetylase OafA/YrhL